MSKFIFKVLYFSFIVLWVGSFLVNTTTAKNYQELYDDLASNLYSELHENLKEELGSDIVDEGKVERIVDDAMFSNVIKLWGILIVIGIILIILILNLLSKSSDISQINSELDFLHKRVKKLEEE